MNMPFAFSIRLPFSSVHVNSSKSNLSEFSIQKPDIQKISDRALAFHPQARALLERAKKLYAAGHLRRTSNVLMDAACILANGRHRELYSALLLIGSAAEIHLFLGKKKTARKYFNAAADLAKEWKLPCSEKELRRRADEIR